MYVELADLVMTRSMSGAGQIIRVGETEPGEPKAIVNHVGVVVKAGEVNRALIVEALACGVVCRPLSVYRRADADCAVVYRLTSLTDTQRQLVAITAQSYIGRPYGWPLIVADALDWLIGSRWFFRRMIQPDTEIVCSSVAGQAFARVVYSFRDGVRPDLVSPDDVWDKVTSSVPPWLPCGVI